MSLDLLNVFEVESEGRKYFLICLVEPVRAGAQGVPMSRVVGEFIPDAAGGFDPDTFVLNPQFIAAFTEYMNDEAIREPALIEQARSEAGGWLYLVDPRFGFDTGKGEPPHSELIGCFGVDATGELVPGSFQYNPEHALFHAATGVSGMLRDRKFYDWLNTRHSDEETRLLEP